MWAILFGLEYHPIENVNIGHEHAWTWESNALIWTECCGHKQMIWLNNQPHTTSHISRNRKKKYYKKETICFIVRFVCASVCRHRSTSSFLVCFFSSCPLRSVCIYFQVEPADSMRSPNKFGGLSHARNTRARVSLFSLYLCLCHLLLISFP